MSQDDKKGSMTIEADAPAVPTAEPSSKIGLPWWVVGGFALAVLVAYGFFTYTMLDFAKQTVPALNWDRALLLFHGVEALAFAAAGALFGVQVQRGQVQQAESRLNDVKRSLPAIKEQASTIRTTLEDNQKSGVVKGAELESTGRKPAADRADVERERAERMQLALIKNLQTSIDAIL